MKARLAGDRRDVTFFSKFLAQAPLPSMQWSEELAGIFKFKHCMHQCVKWEWSRDPHARLSDLQVPGYQAMSDTSMRREWKLNILGN